MPFTTSSGMYRHFFPTEHDGPVGPEGAVRMTLRKGSRRPAGPLLMVSSPDPGFFLLSATFCGTNRACSFLVATTVFFGTLGLAATVLSAVLAVLAVLAVAELLVLVAGCCAGLATSTGVFGTAV